MSTENKKNIDLSTLNDEQRAAVLVTDGAVLVTAGAGSGKTRLLTHRIAYLIEEKGVKPYNILAITFTNKAANEMKERLENMVPTAGSIWVSTFHSMCVRILRAHIDKLGYNKNFSIYGTQERESVIKKVVQKLAETNRAVFGSDSKVIDGFRQRAQYIISDAKNTATTPDEYLEAHLGTRDVDILCEIFKAYENTLQENNALDFDDLLVKTYELLKKEPEVLEYYRNKFRYIHVDEFQDTNVVQYLLVKMLAYPSGNVFVVGDEDQCIYGWRGANIGNILEFQRDFDCKIFKLERNYRSTKNILSFANSVISNNSERLEKKLWTQNDGGESVSGFCAVNETNEAEYVTSVIKNLVSDGQYKYSDFAVLMRLNALSRSFEERFLAYNIPHKMYGGFKFFDRKEIKDILAYLRVLVNRSDSEAILRIINFPKRGIGAGAVSQLVNYSEVMNRPLAEIIMNIESNPDLPLSLIKKITPFKNVLSCLYAAADKKPSEITEYLVKLLNLTAEYADDTEENISRKLNISYLAESMRQYERANPDLSLPDYMQMITLYSDVDDLNEDDDKVCLATIHSVKGLEFNVVFIVACEDGILPLSRSLDNPSELEEERRLMYVAATRARERLYVTRTASRFMYNERKSNSPSRFLKEAGMGTRSAQPSAAMARERIGYSGESGYCAPYGGTAAGSAPVYSGGAKPLAQKNAAVYKEGMTVRHQKFGVGKIVSIDTEAGGVYGRVDFVKTGVILLSLTHAPLEIVDE